MSTTLRVGTNLECSKEHFAGFKSIKIGTQGRVTAIDKTHCTISVQRAFFYRLPFKDAQKIWCIDIKTELYYKGMLSKDLKKMDSLPPCSSSEIKRSFIRLRKSGVKDADFIREMKECIDSEVMQRALK